MVIRRGGLLNLYLEECAFGPRLYVACHIPAQSRKAITPTTRLSKHVLLRLPP